MISLKIFQFKVYYILRKINILVSIWLSLNNWKYSKNLIIHI